MIAYNFYSNNSLMELAATFKEDIAMFVAIETTGLTAVRSNE